MAELLPVGLRFPIYGIATVRRRDYSVFDRGQLAYLNFINKFHCTYCEYGCKAKAKASGSASSCIGCSPSSRTWLGIAMTMRSPRAASPSQRAWAPPSNTAPGMATGTGVAGSTMARHIAQSWAALSGAGDPQRAQQAMEALDSMLVDRDAALIRLLDPPFDHSSPSPAYIQGYYVRGVRENGVQYTHAAVWAAMAFAGLGDGRRAWELFRMLNPIQHVKTAPDFEIYNAERYVVAGDVYSPPPHAERGGWTWHTARQAGCTGSSRNRCWA